MPAGISVDRIIGLKELQADLTRISRIARIHWPNKMLDNAAWEIEMSIKQHAPGRIGETVVTEKGPDRRTIIVTHPAAVFVNDGTRASPGRYVPAIGKRLVSGRRRTKISGVVSYDIGMHPGIRATHFFERALIDADRHIDSMYADWIEVRTW